MHHIAKSQENFPAHMVALAPVLISVVGYPVT